jgi:hypothetical protein
MKYLNKIAAIISGVVFLLGCQDPDYPAAIPSSTVRSANVVFINAAPDAPTPASFLVNNAESASIAFPGGLLAVINPSTEQFRITNAIYGVIAPDTLSQKADLVSQTSATAIQGNGHYTLILTDTIKRPFGKGTAFASNKGGLTFVSMITDNVTAPAAGNAGIRFLNMAPGAPSVFLTKGGVALAGTLSTSRGYKTTTNFTSFTSIQAGSYANIDVRTGSVTGTIIATLPSTTFADGKLYTIFLSGKAVKIGSTTKVKVPYAVNVVSHN